MQHQIQDSPKRPGIFDGPGFGGGAEGFATGAYNGFAAGRFISGETGKTEEKT
jgi:hypothetical protein